MSAAGNLYIGLMSGTSSDAIDAALVRITDTSVTLLQSLAVPISSSLVTSISAAVDESEDRLDDLYTLDVALGEAFAEAALELMGLCKNNKITAIGSHGQTIRHRPNHTRPYSVQLGSGAVIATRTGITTVTDFRSGDIALGGQGAPLVPAFHQSLFAAPDEHRVILNIGGIANATILPSEGPILGFDTGPGNTLLDHWYRCHRDGQFDHNGNWSRQGCCLPKLLDTLLQDPYFSQPLPKSTGLEYFNLNWLRRHLDGTEKAQDVQATLVQLTSEAIARTLRIHAPQTHRMYLCGGGVRNRHLVDQIQTSLSSVSVQQTDALGVPADWVEAVAFAWLARQRLKGLTTSLPEVTGSSRSLSLGAVYLP
ncbi:MAG: anhydro-N-acetylmuramic acid kinase [Pseudomonadota bacterium]|nr:anhydro-N-acetylmuramic acid kinase [Pseudomonadota bacterium]MEE3288886.1 anhydro-N-acetylmuramic acid kinase [Pseudomonadota bacterium]